MFMKIVRNYRGRYVPLPVHVFPLSLPFLSLSIDSRREAEKRRKDGWGKENSKFDYLRKKQIRELVKCYSEFFCYHNNPNI